MNQDFRSTRPAVRGLCAALALMAAGATCLSVDGLARRYSGEAQQLAKANPILLAQAKKPVHRR
jgi:hypothetical protein